MADNFVWYELVTSDEDAAQSFYHDVIGWEAAPFGGEGAPGYRIFSMKGKGIGGLMHLPEGMTHPFWLGYVGVADCDAAVERAKAAGAVVHRVVDLPEVGKLAFVNDPQGVGYALIQGYSEQKSEAFNQALPGHGNWNELYSSDALAGFDYYAGQYGWTKGPTIPLGSMGDYQLFQVDGVDVGGMMNAQPGGMQPRWLYYFGVPSIDRAAEIIAAKGGTILHGPSEVPGGAWILQAADPQGAIFAVTGPR
jgi:predicted enzyme related to lactoylglutathione lyase